MPPHLSAQDKSGSSGNSSRVNTDSRRIAACDPHNVGMTWTIYAILSACFGALVAIFGKIGVRDVDSTLTDDLQIND